MHNSTFWSHVQAFSPVCTHTPFAECILETLAQHSSAHMQYARHDHPRTLARTQGRGSPTHREALRPLQPPLTPMPRASCALRAALHATAQAARATGSNPGTPLPHYTHAHTHAHTHTHTHMHTHTPHQAYGCTRTSSRDGRMPPTRRASVCAPSAARRALRGSAGGGAGWPGAGAAQGCLASREYLRRCMQGQSYTLSSQAHLGVRYAWACLGGQCARVCLGMHWWAVMRLVAPWWAMHVGGPWWSMHSGTDLGGGCTWAQTSVGDALGHTLLGPAVLWSSIRPIILLGRLLVRRDCTNAQRKRARHMAGAAWLQRMARQRRAARCGRAGAATHCKAWPPSQE